MTQPEIHIDWKLLRKYNRREKAKKYLANLFWVIAVIIFFISMFIIGYGGAAMSDGVGMTAAIKSLFQ